MRETSLGLSEHEIRMVRYLCLSAIPEPCWRALVAALAAKGWSLRKGGGLDFSWAVLDRNDIQIRMECDIWCDGEMTFPSASAALIKASLDPDLSAEFQTRLDGAALPDLA